METFILPAPKFVLMGLENLPFIENPFVAVLEVKEKAEINLKGGWCLLAYVAGKTLDGQHLIYDGYAISRQGKMYLNHTRRTHTAVVEIRTYVPLRTSLIRVK